VPAKRRKENAPRARWSIDRTRAMGNRQSSRRGGRAIVAREVLMSRDYVTWSGTTLNVSSPAGSA